MDRLGTVGAVARVVGAGAMASSGGGPRKRHEVGDIWAYESHFMKEFPPISYPRIRSYVHPCGVWLPSKKMKVPAADVGSPSSSTSSPQRCSIVLDEVTLVRETIVLD